MTHKRFSSLKFTCVAYLFVYFFFRFVYCIGTDASIPDRNNFVFSVRSKSGLYAFFCERKKWIHLIWWAHQQRTCSHLIRDLSRFVPIYDGSVEYGKGFFLSLSPAARCILYEKDLRGISSRCSVTQKSNLVIFLHLYSLNEMWSNFCHHKSICFVSIRIAPAN